MPTVTIPAGTLHYRTAGPADSTTPPVVFVHGFLVDSRLWDGVADRLAARGSAPTSSTGRSGATARRCCPTPTSARPGWPG